MRDDTTNGSDALDEGALLAAYLDGDTDEVTAARLERRLRDEPALAARLDALAETRGRLQRLDLVTAPDDARERLRRRLVDERAPVAPVTTSTPGRTSRWPVRIPPAFAAAAAIVLVAVIGLAAVLTQLGVGGAVDSGGAEVAADRSASSEAAAADLAPEAAAPRDEAAGGAPGASEAGSGGSGGSDRAALAAAQVDGDADIAARAERLRTDPPASLRTREQRLRDRAGLPTGRICVREVDATTVDLVDEGGRVALAVLVDDASPQIVLLDPRTCAAIRTISTQR